MPKLDHALTMNTIQIGTSSLAGSRLAYGCWRIAGRNPAELTPAEEAAGRRAVTTAYEAGYTLFDHADIYGQGVAESLFGQVLKQVAGMREQIIIATKCGVCPKGTPDPGLPARWDFSADHIVAACEGSLKRMAIETIDLLMLHRPDYLADPEEIARAFAELKSAGKVRFFGLSNFRPSLVTLIQATCGFPLVASGRNQSCEPRRLYGWHFGPVPTGSHDALCLESVGARPSRRRRDIPSARAGESYRTAPIVAELDKIAKTHGTSRTAIALAWLLKHPSKIVPIIGSTKPEQIAMPSWRRKPSWGGTNGIACWKQHGRSRCRDNTRPGRYDGKPAQ